MARKNILKMVMSIAQALVAIAVGMALTEGTLVVPFVGVTINLIVGWIAVAGGVLGLGSVLGLKILK